MPLAASRSIKSPAPLLFVFPWSTGFIGTKVGLTYAGPFSFRPVRCALLVVLSGIALLGMGSAVAGVYRSRR